MKTKIATILFYCCCGVCLSQSSINQDSIKRKNIVQHSLFIEFFGSSASYYNLMYDCSFLLAEKHKIAIAAGIGYLPPLPVLETHPSVNVSLQANYLYGKKHHLEIGVGVAFPELYAPTNISYSSDGRYEVSDDWRFSTNHLIIPVRIGYRYQKNRGGLFWKAAFVPYFSEQIYHVLKLPFVPGVGVSIGYTFNSEKQ